MLVFLDESGDTGLKFDKGSSSIFIVVLVVFESNEAAEATDRSIAKLKGILGLPESYEFHFTHTHPNYKKLFFEAIANHTFSYYGIVINKELLHGKGFQYKDPFYKYVCHLVFQNAKSYLHKAKVVLDKRGDKDFNRTFSTYLKQRMNQEQECIRKIVSQNSKNNNLIQLADMICGAIKCCYKQSRRDLSFRKTISHLERNLQIWPKK